MSFRTRLKEEVKVSTAITWYRWRSAKRDRPCKDNRVHNQDNGWFKNLHTDEAFGEVDIRMVRPVLTWDPTDDMSVVLRYQYESADGDGPAAQNHTNGAGGMNADYNFDRDSHDFSINEEGTREIKSHFFHCPGRLGSGFRSRHHNQHIRFFDSDTFAMLDLDSSPQSIAHAGGWTKSRQWSNELRYTGGFSITST